MSDGDVRAVAAGSLAPAAEALLGSQRRGWPTARDNYAALAGVRTRELDVGGLRFRLQFNPARIVSTGAKVDAAAIAARPCFLCRKNLPPEQRAVPFGDDFDLLVNPFPILPEHFTVPHRDHVPQRLEAEAVTRMLELSRGLGEDHLVFYNGPKCGASAPDHLHFQAGNASSLPFEREIDPLAKTYGRPAGLATLLVASPLRPFVLVLSTDAAVASTAVLRAVAAWGRAAGQSAGDDEPMVNVLAWYAAPVHRVAILPRVRHRPSFYFAEADEKILLSPASIDLGGLCVCPVERDFDRLTPAHLQQMLAEVCPDPAATNRLLGALRNPS